MDAQRPDPTDTEITDLPEGWSLIERFDGATMIILTFQKDGLMGYRATGIGTTFEEAVRFGLARMDMYEQRDRLRWAEVRRFR